MARGGVQPVSRRSGALVALATDVEHRVLALVDLEAPWIVDADALKSKSKNAAIEGRKLQGKVEACFVNGHSVFDSKMDTTK